MAKEFYDPRQLAIIRRVRMLERLDSDPLVTLFGVHISLDIVNKPRCADVGTLNEPQILVLPGAMEMG